MKKYNFKKWKLVSFGIVVFMIVHLILLEVFHIQYRTHFSWGPIFYLIPVLSILALSIVGAVSKNPSTHLSIAVVKLCVIETASFVIFTVMLMEYHNPTKFEYVFLLTSCLFIGICGILLFIFERCNINYKWTIEDE